MDVLEGINTLARPTYFGLLPIAVDLIRGVHEVQKRWLHEGLYEVLEYDAVLELQDVQGIEALFRKHHKVKFLQDNVIAYEDYAWGEGELFADYKCSPGLVVDRYQEGNRWNVLISLRATKSRGDIEDFYIERKISSGFTQHEEWWQVAMQHETKWLKLSVIFPRDRKCQRAVLVERTRNRTTPLSPANFTVLSDGRQMLRWETKKPRRFETYTFKWWW